MDHHSSSPRSAFRSSSSIISSLLQSFTFSLMAGSGSNSERYSLIPSLTPRLLSSRSFPTNLLRNSRFTFLKKCAKKMSRKVPSMARMFERSGKNRRTERELFASGSEISFAENLARLAVRRSQYWWMSLRWSQMAYCRLSLNFGITEASLAATSGQQGLKVGSRVQISTRTVATSWKFLMRRSRMRCVASRQSLESIRHRKICLLISVTMWKDLASSRSRRFSPTTSSNPPSPYTPYSPSLSLKPWSSCSHQFIREASTPASSSNLSVKTSFSFSISLGTFLLMKVSRKAMR